MSSAAGTNWPSSSQKYGRLKYGRCARKTIRAKAAARSSAGMSRLLDGTGLAGVRLQLDFAESRLILRNVLRQHVQQSFGLLRAHVHALKIVDGHAMGRGWG